MISGNILASAFRHLVAHVCYINFLFSMPLSKINKLVLVVTIRRGQFMDSVFVNPGIYSCAVDGLRFSSLRVHVLLNSNSFGSCIKHGHPTDSP